MRSRFISRLLSIALLCATFAGYGTATAQGGPLTLDAYKQLINEAYAAAQRSDRIGLDDLAAEILAADRVQLPAGTTVAVDNTWLRQALAQEPPDFPLITARLGAILDALGQPRTEPDPDALAKLDAVYEAPPFKSRSLPSALGRVWRRITGAISDFLENLFGNLPAPNPAPAAPATGFQGLSPAGVVLLIVALVLIVGIVVYAVRGVRRSIIAEARAREEAAEEETLTAAEAAEKAQAGVRAGDYRNAVRYLYLSSLLWLEERGAMRYDRSRTNREHLAQLRGKPLHDELAPVVETFERVWYGQAPLSADDFGAYERQVSALRSKEERPA